MINLVSGENIKFCSTFPKHLSLGYFHIHFFSFFALFTKNINQPPVPKGYSSVIFNILPDHQAFTNVHLLAEIRTRDCYVKHRSTTGLIYTYINVIFYENNVFTTGTINLSVPDIADIAKKQCNYNISKTLLI